MNRSKYSQKYGETAVSEFVDEATQRKGLERIQENVLMILTSGLQKLGSFSWPYVQLCRGGVRTRHLGIKAKGKGEGAAKFNCFSFGTSSCLMMCFHALWRLKKEAIFQ